MIVTNQRATGVYYSNLKSEPLYVVVSADWNLELYFKDAEKVQESCAPKMAFGKYIKLICVHSNGVYSIQTHGFKHWIETSDYMVALGIFEKMRTARIGRI